PQQQRSGASDRGSAAEQAAKPGVVARRDGASELREQHLLEWHEDAARNRAELFDDSEQAGSSLAEHRSDDDHVALALRRSHRELRMRGDQKPRDAWECGAYAANRGPYPATVAGLARYPHRRERGREVSGDLSSDESQYANLERGTKRDDDCNHDRRD